MLEGTSETGERVLDGEFEAVTMIEVGAMVDGALDTGAMVSVGTVVSGETGAALGVVANGAAVGASFIGTAAGAKAIVGVAVGVSISLGPGDIPVETLETSSTFSKMLSPENVAQSILYAVMLPKQAVVDELTLMPSAGVL